MQGAAGYYAVPLGSLGGILAVLEAHLGRLGGLFGCLGALWGLSWEPLGPFWSHLGGFLDDLGGPLGRLGLSENPKGGKAKIDQKPMKINDFGLFEPSWRTSWRHLWGLLGRLGLS